MDLINVGDMAVEYHTDLIGVVVAVRREDNSNTSDILLLRHGALKWVSIENCFRWFSIV